MADKTEIWQGTLALMVLTTLQSMGPLHGYGIARRIEQSSGDALSVNYGTLYVEVTIDDPKAYTHPWTVKFPQRLMPDNEIIEFICAENNVDAKHYK